jgi:5-methylthioadenosine/S-adenosylhomocysteine deaminase
VNADPPVLLEDGLVVTLDDQGTIEQGSVAIRAGRIADVGDAGELRRAFPDAERIDCSGRIVMPGFVNAHLHPEAHVLKGTVEELDLHGWAGAQPFERALAYLGAEPNRWVQLAATRASLADCLLSGTTCVATYGITIGGDEAAAAVLAELGLRGHVTIRDLAFAPASGAAGSVIPAYRLEPPRMYRLHAEEALSVAELDAAGRAHGRGERLIMHAAETRWRRELMEDTFGAPTVQVLARHGLLSERMLLSHAVHVDAGERALLERAGAAVIASPSADAKLSDGIAPVADYVARGLTVALGTDSAVCNNGNDMFLECRQLGLLQKLSAGADALPADRILRSATRGGARALGEADRYGRIAAGQSADVIMVDTRNERLQPLVHRAGFSNVAANLVYAAVGPDVTDVFVRGRRLVRDRRLTVADRDRILEDLGRAGAALHDALD